MKYKNNIILEFAQFGSGPNQFGSTPNSVGVDNPGLSHDYYDKFSNLVQQAQVKLNQILATVKSDIRLNSPKNLPEQELSEMVVQKIVCSNVPYYNIYFRCTINETEYFGIIINFGSPHPILKCEAFNDGDNLLISKEWVIRTKGVILKSIRNWLSVDNGEWICLKDIRSVNVKSGKEFIIPKNTKVNVVRTYDFKVFVTYKGDTYYLSSAEYMYFNYWFIKS